MLFSRQTFSVPQGFGERYFLYYEGVDLCARTWLAGIKVVLNLNAVVVHAAQRTSHRKLKCANWHLTSMSRVFISGVFRRLIRLRDVRVET